MAQLTVAHIPQEQPNSCWHASARMVFGYKKRTSTHPLPGTYAVDLGLDAAAFVNLAAAMGLQSLPQVNQSFSLSYLDSALTKYGPLWAAGQWNGPNHIVVITGTGPNGQVFVNDPAFPTPVVRDIAWFNERIDKNVSMPLMYLP